MTQPIVVKEASLPFPIVAADTSGKTGVVQYASSTSNTSVAIPAGMYGRFLKVESFGVASDVGISLGAAATLTMHATSTLGVGSATAGWSIPTDGFVDGVVPARQPNQTNVTHYLNFISSATGGYVVITCSEI